MKPVFANIPPELINTPHWVCFGRSGTSPGEKPYKIPYNPRSGYAAKAGEPATWAEFATAWEAVERGAYAGVGFEFQAGGGLVGVDFDHCLDPVSGACEPWAAAWVNRLGSYTEISPSGTGLHVFCKGVLPGKGIKRPRAEVYDSARYFTVTGNAFGTPRPLCNAQDALNTLYAELTAETAKGLDKPTQGRSSPALPPADKDYLAIGLERDAALRRLWDGGRPNGNESADDMALMNKLAYWCNANAEHMAAAFCSSPHFTTKDAEHQKKANRADYIPCTAEKAVTDCKRTAAQDDATHTASKAQDVFGRAEHTGQTPKAKPKLSTITARALQQKDIPPAKFIVVDLLPQGLALLVSPPKFGKSWFVLDLCLSVAAGQSFLKYKTVKSGCLYLALEDSERRLKDRMNKVLCGQQAPDQFSYATSAEEIGAGLLAQLETYLSEHPGTGLIVIDTLQKVRGAVSGKENAYSADYKEVGALKSFADQHGVCVLLVHHLRKMRDDADPFNQISGTNGIFGAADTAMVMTRAKRGNENTTFSVIGRDIDSSESVLRFDKERYRWQNLGDADFLEREHARLDYLASPIIHTVRKLVEQGGGRWSGTTQELMTAGMYIARASLATSPQKLGRELKLLDPLLFEHDTIIHTRAGNGSGGGKHNFSLSTVPINDTNVGLEQQTLV